MNYQKIVPHIFLENLLPKSFLLSFYDQIIWAKHELYSCTVSIIRRFNLISLTKHTKIYYGLFTIFTDISKLITRICLRHLLIIYTLRSNYYDHRIFLLHQEYLPIHFIGNTLLPVVEFTLKIEMSTNFSATPSCVRATGTLELLD